MTVSFPHWYIKTILYHKIPNSNMFIDLPRVSYNVCSLVDAKFFLTKPQIWASMQHNQWQTRKAFGLELAPLPKKKESFLFDYIPYYSTTLILYLLQISHITIIMLFSNFISTLYINKYFCIITYCYLILLLINGFFRWSIDNIVNNYF